MSAKTLALFSALVLLLSGSTLFLYLEMRRAASGAAAARLETGRLAGRVMELEGALNATRMALEEERSAAARSAQANQAREQASRAESLEGDSGRENATRPPPRAALLQSADDADAIARELVARYDARGMLDMLGELLAMGEPGFKKLCSLAAEQNIAETIREGDTQFMRTEVFRFLQDRSEELLRLGLFLDARQSECIPDRMRNDFLLSDEELPMLLGLYRGEDQDLLQRYTRKLRLRAEGEAAAEGKVQDATLRGLALISSDAAVDALVDLLPSVSAEHQPPILSALQWQGSARALPALHSLRQGTADAERRSLIDSIIQRLK